MMRPIQYQKGYSEFYKLRFKVTPDVLIPRPETELLVDEILNFLASQGYTLQETTILDLGTGSGNIAISIVKNLPADFPIKIIATDISQNALKIAKLNAKLHQVLDRIIFVRSNLLSAFINSKILCFHPWDGKQEKIQLQDIQNINVIVANLPYIPSCRIPYLDPSVKDFEPLIALDGGEDGFELYRKLFKQIKTLMNQKSWGVNLSPPLGCYLVGEIDYTHGELAILEAQKYFPGAKIEVKTDLVHNQRLLVIKTV